jgi:hypothetical protein
MAAAASTQRQNADIVHHLTQYIIMPDSVRAHLCQKARPSATRLFASSSCTRASTHATTQHHNLQSNRAINALGRSLLLAYFELAAKLFFNFSRKATDFHSDFQTDR